MMPKHERRVYLLWEEARAPSVVFELSSRATRREDVSRYPYQPTRILHRPNPFFHLLPRREPVSGDRRRRLEHEAHVYLPEP
jgi:hypothetical protein